MDAVGKKVIEESIRSQLAEDKRLDEMTRKECTDPFTGGKHRRA